jgi:hypothetical protein
VLVPAAACPRTLAAALLAVGLALTGCSGTPHGAATGTPSPAGPASTSPPPSAAPSPILTNPLTGEAVRTRGAVLIVKVGNGSWERPPIGVADADVVYVEMVEGGLTRLAAVFSSRLPARVGPVRSARETDAELFTQYGAAALAYSGVDRHVVPALQASPLRLVSFDASPRGYVRDFSRGRGASNVVGDPVALLARARAGGRVARAHDVGFRFGPLPAGGRPASSVSARWPSAHLVAVWERHDRRWRFTMDGRPYTAAGGARLGAATVLVQYVPTTYLGRHDSAGAPVSFSRTVGVGTGLVARDGRVYRATWSRAHAADGTVWSIGGQRAQFARGPLWVLLVPEGRTVTLG